MHWTTMKMLYNQLGLQGKKTHTQQKPTHKVLSDHKRDDYHEEREVTVGSKRQSEKNKASKYSMSPP